MARAQTGAGAGGTPFLPVARPKESGLPVRNMDQPMIGMRKLLVLLMNLNCRIRWNRL